MLAAALPSTRPGPVSVLLATITYAMAVTAAERDAPAAARLEVDAPSGCATRAEVIARVRARSPRVSFVDDAEALVVRAQFLTLPSGGVSGELTLTRTGTKPVSRRVTARSCSEAADALALMIAVTLDPTTVDQSGGATAAGNAGPPSTSTEESNGSPPDENAQPLKPATSTPVPARTTPESEPEPSLPTRVRFGVELAFQSFVGPTPEIMPGIALYLMAGVDRPALWSPVVLLGGTHAWRTVEEEGGTATFMFDAASFDACPFRWVWRRIEARPCGSVLVGRLSARASETRNAPDEIARPFWVVGGAALVTVQVAWVVEASARVGVGANLVRDSFVFTPDTFHEVPPVTVAGSVGVGMRLP